MPIERKAWACRWRCGASVQTVKSRMEKHEARCWRNPERKACASCRYFTKERDGNGMEGTPYDHTWTNVFCAADDSIDFGPESTQLRQNCPLWATTAPTTGEGE